MNKLPTKQIYLLLVIIVGIFALSIYSTYAIFTFESETSDIVSIHTPKSLKISTTSTEYQQVEILANDITTVDIDIYNTQEYDICYSIWYKVLGTEEETEKITILEKNDDVLKTSGLLEQNTSLRVTIVIINDNDKNIKVNLGTSNSKLEETCSLKLETGKKTITEQISQIKLLSSEILEQKKQKTESEEGYLIYKQSTSINYNINDKVVVSDEFTYKNEKFSLKNSKEITANELLNYDFSNNDYYFCKDTSCYQLIKIEKVVNDDNNIVIAEYSELRGYQKTTSGLRQIDNNYIYYGDNPQNFIKFNCNSESCELWRIIGLYHNQNNDEYQIKIVRNDSIGKYQYSDEIDKYFWEESLLADYLNNEYDLNGYDKYLVTKDYQEEIFSDIKTLEEDEESIRTTLEDSKLGLLSINDYLKTSSCNNLELKNLKNSCITNNWLNNITNDEWTNSIFQEVIKVKIEKEEATEQEEPENTEEEKVTEELEEVPEEEYEEKIINKIYTIGSNLELKETNDYADIRPVGYLTKRILYISGNGSIDNPYIIK